MLATNAGFPKCRWHRNAKTAIFRCSSVSSAFSEMNTMLNKNLSSTSILINIENRKDIVRENSEDKIGWYVDMFVINRVVIETKYFLRTRERANIINERLFI